MLTNIKAFARKNPNKENYRSKRLKNCPSVELIWRTGSRRFYCIRATVGNVIVNVIFTGKTPSINIYVYVYILCVYIYGTADRW